MEDRTSEIKQNKTSQLDGQHTLYFNVEVICSSPLVILLTVAMVACGIWGACNVAVVFDIRTLLPERSYLMEWIDRNEIAFPVDGFGFGVDFYTEDLEYRDGRRKRGP